MNPVALPPPVAKPTVEVARVGGAFRVLAAHELHSGEAILHLDGELFDHPTRYSVQIGVGRHLDLPPGVSLLDELDRYPWRFLNHSCDPNAALRGRHLFALRPIRAGEEVTFDYNTTEYEMAEPFECRCGSLRCLGEVRGYRYLPSSGRAAIAALVADHVRILAEGEAIGG